MASRQGACPGAIPGNRTIFPQAARQIARQSLQNSVGSGQHRGGAPISWGRGRQVMHLPCKQVDEGALPSDSTNFKTFCGENEIQARLISSASVGATPPPLPFQG